MHFYFWLFLLLMPTMVLPATGLPIRSSRQSPPMEKISLVHSQIPTAKLPAALSNIKPSQDEIEYLKEFAATSQLKKTSCKHTNIKTKLISIFKEEKPLSLLVTAPNPNDSFYLNITYQSPSKVLCELQTSHTTCPSWISHAVEEGFSQAVNELRTRQLKIAGGCIALVALASYSLAQNKQRLTTTNQGEPTTWKATPKTRASSKEHFLVRFKKMLTTTPFIEFVVHEDEDEIPAVPKTITHRTIKVFCRNYDADFLYADDSAGILDPFDLTKDEMMTFLKEPFKETTIDLLARFQHAYSITLSEEGYAEDPIRKAMELVNFKCQIRELQKTDPVEAKRILSFHPLKIWNKLTKQAFYRSSYVDPAPLAHINKPQKGEMDYYDFPSFSGIIHRASLPDGRNDNQGAYCLKDQFPRDFAMFAELDTVKASS